MRKRIVNSIFALSAAAILAAVFSLALLAKYWAARKGASLGAEPEFIFYALLIVAFILSAVAALSVMLANSIVRPLERSIDDYVELSHLKRRLDAQSSLLQTSTSELEEKERNLSLVVANMSEGLILLDRKGIVVMMNMSAGTLLGVDCAEYLGKHIFAANSSVPLQAAVNEALGGKSASDVLETANGTVEISVNSVAVEKIIRGAVVFLRDITERQAAEKMRREFSANVSHELKTPLTSISGYAELMKEGLAKPDDTLWFATKIYDEAQRLISLTDDIMRLSRLDEGGPTLQVEKVDIYPIVQKVAERLGGKARSHQVELTVHGGAGLVSGNSGLLDEMIYNLCDNAIKYNKPGGSVSMSVRTAPGKVIFTVEDTGVGIPPEHQSRVFERFYRVDKSHSKATGGTGLGLSIVKNGAAFHKARVELHSKAGEGTAIRLFFNRADT